mgnify:CR=1 FL=1
MANYLHIGEKDQFSFLPENFHFWAVHTFSEGHLTFLAPDTINNGYSFKSKFKATDPSRFDKYIFGARMFLLTLDSGINIRLLIFGLFSRGYLPYIIERVMRILFQNILCLMVSMGDAYFKGYIRLMLNC